MKNQVIKVLNKEHGKKVIQYWKNKNIDIGYFDKAMSNEEVGDKFIYYGTINKKFGNYNIEYILSTKTEIIELPKEF